MRELFYADDCNIATHSENEIQCFMNCFAHAYKAFGIEINLKKNVMHDPVLGLPSIEQVIYIEGKKLDMVHSFVYLGNRLAERCSFGNEISLRTEKAFGSFSGLEKRV